MMTLSMSFSFTSLPVSPNLQLQPHSDQRFFTKCINVSAITTSFAAVKCNSVADDSSELGGGGGGGGSLNLKDLTSGMVDERVKQIMNNEEKRVLLVELEKATQRVEMAMKQLSIIQQQQPQSEVGRRSYESAPF